MFSESLYSSYNSFEPLRLGQIFTCISLALDVREYLTQTLVFAKMY